MKGIGVTRNCMGMTSFFDGATPDTGLDQACLLTASQAIGLVDHQDLIRRWWH